MPLVADDPKHKAQIEAGTTGRKKGHLFEKELAKAVSTTRLVAESLAGPKSHLVRGHPAIELVSYIARTEQLSGALTVKAWWVGGLATGSGGDILTDVGGRITEKSKSDVVLEIQDSEGCIRRGVSVKTCSKKTPTNDQLYFTTAVAFCSLLRQNGISVSMSAETALRMFCGDVGYRPMDEPSSIVDRQANPERWFWEELPRPGREKLEGIFSKHQRKITQILLQTAYVSDPFPPEYLLHQTVAYSDINDCPLAIFKISELVDLSCKYSGFSTKPYRIHKGRYKNDPAVHLAPRFGFVQFQRGGQKQHPTQLQFNLAAGYFNKLPGIEPGSGR